LRNAQREAGSQEGFEFFSGDLACRVFSAELGDSGEFLFGKSELENPFRQWRCEILSLPQFLKEIGFGLGPRLRYHGELLGVIRFNVHRNPAWPLLDSLPAAP